MTDTREDVLVRLTAILQTIPNIRHTARNTAVDLPDNRLPAAVLFDGDENAADRIGAPTGRPRLMEMAPEIVLVQQAREAGSDLSTLRRELVKRITLDATLETIIAAPVGFVVYDGCRTDFGAGRSLQGGLIAQFTIRYVLHPQQL
jgi:hypothetical protein